MDDQFSGHYPYYSKGHETVVTTAELVSLQQPVVVMSTKAKRIYYQKKYKDLQAVVTTAELNVSLLQPVVVMNIKAKANPQVLKVASGGKGKGPIGKGKGTKFVNKGKGSTAKPTSTTDGASAGPTANTRAKAKDSPVVTVTMLQDLMDELEAIEQESPNDDHKSEATQDSDLEQKIMRIV